VKFSKTKNIETEVIRKQAKGGFDRDSNSYRNVSYLDSLMKYFG